MRVSATLLDAFRMLREYDFMTPEEFDSRVRRDPIEPTDAMRLGTAFHAVAEGLAEHDPGMALRPATYAYDGCLFDGESADHALAAYRCGGGLPEVKAADVQIASRHGPITLVGKVDYLVGVTARELKTKARRDLDPSFYANGWQWRVYCRVFEARQVVYDLVRLDERGGRWYATHDDLTLYPYPGLDDQVDGECRDLVAYVQSRGLLDYLAQSSGT